MRGAIRDFIQATTPYRVCDAVDNDMSVIHRVRENRCDLMLLRLTTPLQDTLVTVSVLRSKLPHVKIVGFSSFSYEGNRVFPSTGFDAIIAQQDGLSKLVETLKALMPDDSGR